MKTSLIIIPGGGPYNKPPEQERETLRRDEAIGLQSDHMTSPEAAASTRKASDRNVQDRRFPDQGG